MYISFTPFSLVFLLFLGVGQGQGQGLTKALNNLDLNYILKYSEGQKKTCIKLVSFPSF
jgi:hypothetical protein